MAAADNGKEGGAPVKLEVSVTEGGLWPGDLRAHMLA